MHNNNGIRKGKPRFVFTAAAVITAVMLVGITAISTLTTAESVFAYRNNQAASQANDCGNGSVPIDTVLCQNTGSQIQGDANVVVLAAQQRFGEVIPPGACSGCFEPLSEPQLNAVAEILTEEFGIIFPTDPTRQEIIDTICDALETGELTVGDLGEVMEDIAIIPRPNSIAVSNCLHEIFDV
jgi:hypothetical protein